MVSQDPISDMIIRIKNASLAGKQSVTFPYSKHKLAIARVLEKEGFISSIEHKGKKTTERITCRIVYKEDGKPRLQEIKRQSKPSRRIYKGTSEIRAVRQGAGTAVLTTPKGIMTDKEARKNKVGGELLFVLW